MRKLFFNLSLILCSLFIFSITAAAHPHKLGEMNHGPSLEAYQIELDFSSNHMVQDIAISEIKIADKKKGYKDTKHKKPNKNKTQQKSKQTRKHQNENKK